MTGNMWLGLWLGGILGVIYVAVSYLTSHLAARRVGSRFTKVFLGGMIVRMLVALGVIFLVLTSTSADHMVFLFTFLVIFVIGVAGEMLHLHRSS